MKIYPLGLVGESNYQAAIAETFVGQTIKICHEPDNPFDGLALRAENSAGQLIGYIPKRSWLREAIHEQGRGVAATVREIHEGPEGLLGVVINVTLTDDPVFERAYGHGDPAATVNTVVRETTPPEGGSLAGFIKGVFAAFR